MLVNKLILKFQTLRLLECQKDPNNKAYRRLEVKHTNGPQIKFTSFTNSLFSEDPNPKAELTAAIV